MGEAAVSSQAQRDTLLVVLITLGDPGRLTGDSLAEDLQRGGEPAERIRVVPPGRDVATAIGPAPGDLRRGRRTAFLCVGNWVERKGIIDLLDAFGRLPDELATLHLVGDSAP